MQSVPGLRLRRERIEALNDDDNVTLRGLIAGATRQTERADPGCGCVTRLASKSARSGPLIAVARLSDAAACGWPAPFAFVLVSDPCTQPPGFDEMLRKPFTLSTVEPRAAEWLTMVDSLDRLAESLRAGVTTMRWRLAALYRKTGTIRQTELVRLPPSVPTVWSSPRTYSNRWGNCIAADTR